MGSVCEFLESCDGLVIVWGKVQNKFYFLLGQIQNSKETFDGTELYAIRSAGILVSVYDKYL